MLISLARNGDDKAMAQLIEMAMPIAKAKAYAYSLAESGRRVHFEDLSQEGMLGFLDALHSYSPDGEASFTTYASTCIGNRIIDAVRANRNSKNSSLSTAVPITDIAERAGYDTPQDTIESDERYRRIVNFLTDEKELSKIERDVIRLYLEGRTYAEISGYLCISVKSVDNALQRVRKKLRSANIMPR